MQKKKKPLQISKELNICLKISVLKISGKDQLINGLTQSWYLVFPAITCHLCLMKNWFDLVAFSGAAVTAACGCTETQSAIVCLHTTEICSGCCCTVRHLLINIVCLHRGKKSLLRIFKCINLFYLASEFSAPWIEPDVGMCPWPGHSPLLSSLLSVPSWFLLRLQCWFPCLIEGHKE